MSSAGKAFIVITAATGLGMFCGPIMDLASSWKDSVPGGLLALASVTFATGAVMFSYIEEMSEFDAAYLSFITGTTIGYGDVTPTSDIGKIAVACYAICAINVFGALLDTAKVFLESFCRDDSKDESTKEPPVDGKKDD